MIMLGTRSYMQQVNHKSSATNSTVLVVVLLYTRAIAGYKSISETVKTNAEIPWGNHFAFLPLSIPKLYANKSSGPSALSWMHLNADDSEAKEFYFSTFD